MNPDERRQPSEDIDVRRVRSAPPVPRGLMSARPPMTSITPRRPEEIAKSDSLAAAAERPPQTPEQAQDRQTRVDYLKSLRKEKPKKRGPKLAIITLLVLLLVVLVGAGAYYVFLAKPDKKDTASSTPTTTQAIQENKQTRNESQNASVAPTKQYTSVNFPLELAYPEDWTVTDTAGKLTLVSPSMGLTAADGSRQNGAVVVTIRGQQTTLPEFDKGNATAVLASENVAYTHPTSTQRGSTYFSFLQYATTTTKGALDAVYITGNAGYQKGQYIPKADVLKVDPLVTVSFISCSTKCVAETGAPLHLDSTAWTGSLKTTVEDILKSLQIS